MLKRVFNALDNGDGVGVAALLENRQIDGALTVNANNVGLDGLRVNGFAHVADKHGRLRLADGLQRHGVDIGCRGRLAVGVEVVVVRANLHVAGGENQVGVIDFAHDVHGAQLMRLQLERVHINHDLAVAAAKGLGNRGARNVGNLISNVEASEVLKLGFVEALSL